MSYFRRVVLAKIQTYKTMLDQHVSRDEWRTRIDTLMIGRMQLRSLPDVALYQCARDVLLSIESMLMQSTKASSWYSGMDEFHEHFKQFLSTVTIQGGCLVHSSQKAACALVHSIQILSLPVDIYMTSHVEQLYQYGSLIAALGNPEVHQSYVKLLTDQRTQDHALARTLLTYFRQKLSFSDLNQLL